MLLLWQLFVSYLKIGFFGFGGGYAMLSLIQNEVVVQHQWLTNAQFADIVAISQITPGPIAINSATYVGYSVGVEAGSEWFGILGSMIATFAVCLPSLTLMILVARFFMRLKNNRLVEGAMRGMRPAVIGMIAAAALLLIFPHSDAPDEQNFIHPADRPLGCGRSAYLLRILRFAAAGRRAVRRGGLPLKGREKQGSAREEEHQEDNQAEDPQDGDRRADAAPPLLAARQGFEKQRDDQPHEGREEQAQEKRPPETDAAVAADDSHQHREQRAAQYSEQNNRYSHINANLSQGAPQSGPA